MDVEQNRRRSHASGQSAGLYGARWSPRAQRLLQATQVLFVEGLQEPLRRCLGELEQQLFALAERAHRADQQQDLYASRQRVMQGRSMFEERFIAQLDIAFTEIGHTPKSAAGSDIKPWQSLALLDPAEQELRLKMEQLAARGETRHSGVLYELGYRLAVLIAAPPLEGPALPLGPHAIAKAFHHAGLDLLLPPEHHLLLLQALDQWVIQSLAPLFDSINDHLQADGILPQLRSIPLPRHVGKRSRGAKADPAAGAAPAAGGSAAGGAAGASIEVLESLRNLLAQRRGGALAGNMTPVARVASQDELQTALGALQQHLAHLTEHASRELRSAQRLREELITQLNVDKPAGAPPTQLTGEQGDTVELVAMLFEQLGQQLQQGGNAHALLGDMQLPVLRMAVADQDFFEKPEHPARKLLDAVTGAANDWLDGSDDESNRPLATKLEQLVARASQEPPSAGLYTTLLADIEHHLGLLSRKAQAAERRHVEAAQGRERLDQARQRAGALMAERFAQSPPRGLLRALLDRAWSDVLALTVLRHGEESDEFRAQLAITDQLLGRLPVDDRLQLQGQVESGLQQIGMHAEESRQVAQRLLGTGKESIAPPQVPPIPAHATAVPPSVSSGLPGRSNASTPRPSKPPESIPADLPSATDLAMRLKQHHRLGEEQEATARSGSLGKFKTETPVLGPREARIHNHLSKLPFGSWFEFVNPSTGQITQRKLAWYSSLSGRCLLVSRRGQRGEEMTMAQLAHEIARGHVCEMPAQRESLIERAWRGLTGSLRQPIGARRPNPHEPAAR
jgi:hypothetical protein